MFDYHKFYNRILLLCGIGFIIYGLLQPVGESIIGVRVLVGLFNLVVYFLRKKLGKTFAQRLLIVELYILTPYLFYEYFILEHNSYLMVFSTIVFFSGSFLFLSSKENLIYLLFNGVNIILYLIVTQFVKESLIISFLFICMYIFAFNIHRAFLSSIKRLMSKEKDLKDNFFWMTNAMDSPLTKINELMDIFEIQGQVETVKIEKQVEEIKKQLRELEEKFTN